MTKNRGLGDQMFGLILIDKDIIMLNAATINYIILIWKKYSIKLNQTTL